ncbi:MAG: hypothetical protein CL908_15910 [Deltaproteobacteria bacterium]|nr:hypothetical protein [Deltaproteobacteria bacterium]
MEKLLAYEDRAFADDRVGLASRFFNCMRISLDEIPSASVRKQYGATKGPSILVLDPSGKELKRLTGWSTSGSKLYSSMASVLRSTRKMNLAALLRKENAFLKRLDDLYWKIEDAKFDRTELAKRKGKSAERQMKKLDKGIAVLESQYEQAKKDEDAFLRKLDGEASAADN